MNIIGRYTSGLPIEILFCNTHGETRHALSGKKNSRWKCLECSSDYSYNLKRRNKRKSIEYKGNCCSICGFDKCDSALHFHHLNQETKSFDISQHLSRKWSSLKDELDKCVLLCMNCHFLEHEIIDCQRRYLRKEAMRPKITYSRKEINRINSKKLGISYQP